MGLFSFLKKETKKEAPRKEAPKTDRVDSNVPEKNTTKVLTESDVKMIHDDAKLMEIIKSRYGWDITRTAVSQLHNQKPLKEYLDTLTSYSDNQKRAAVIAGISDQEMLAEIASTEKEYNLRQSVLKRLKDTKVVKEALLERSYSITEVGDMLKKLNRDDQIYVVENSKISSTVEAALRILGDQMMMADYMIKNDTDKLMNLIQDREVLEKIAEEASGLKLRSQAVRKLGGYICTSCGKLNPPDEQLGCSCRFCGAENHDYVHVNNVVEYRDYEVGNTYDECTRCHKKINYRSINTM